MFKYIDECGYKYIAYEYNKNTGDWRFEDEQGTLVLTGSKKEIEKVIEKNNLTKVD